MLIFGVKLYIGVIFEYVIEFNLLEDGWRSKVFFENYFLKIFEFDVFIGVDGKKNVFLGF